MYEMAESIPLTHKKIMKMVKAPIESETSANLGKAMKVKPVELVCCLEESPFWLRIARPAQTTKPAQIEKMKSKNAITNAGKITLEPTGL
jgi:hypothetical protein